jgi:hypothetical protein
MARREPNPAMIGAGDRKAAESLSDDIGGINRAMIDTAIEDLPNAPSPNASSRRR